MGTCVRIAENTSISQDRLTESRLLPRCGRTPLSECILAIDASKVVVSTLQSSILIGVAVAYSQPILSYVQGSRSAMADLVLEPATILATFDDLVQQGTIQYGSEELSTTQDNGFDVRDTICHIQHFSQPD